MYAPSTTFSHWEAAARPVPQPPQPRGTWSSWADSLLLIQRPLHAAAGSYAARCSAFWAAARSSRICMSDAADAACKVENHYCMLQGVLHLVNPPDKWATKWEPARRHSGKAWQTWPMQVAAGARTTRCRQAGRQPAASFDVWIDPKINSNPNQSEYNRPGMPAQTTLPMTWIVCSPGFPSCIVVFNQLHLWPMCLSK